jgi:hypothetical protein
MYTFLEKIIINFKSLQSEHDKFAIENRTQFFVRTNRWVAIQTIYLLNKFASLCPQLYANSTFRDKWKLWRFKFLMHLHTDLEWDPNFYLGL